jgi:lysophospholipase L1-like esterase
LKIRPRSGILPLPLKWWAGGLGLALASICFTLFLLELAARFLLSPPYAFDPQATDVHALNYLACNNRLGWTGQPGFQGVIDSPVFRQEVEANSLGMNDEEHPLEKPADTFRVLVLGDSFIQGFQVEQQQTASQVLEDYLNAEAERRQVEVLSGAVLGWSNGQQLLYYREQGRHFQPDLVLLTFFIGNDFKDNLPGNAATVRGWTCYAPYFTVCGDQLKPQALTYAPGLSRLQTGCAPTQRALINGLGYLYQHSRLYQQLDPLLVSRYPRQVFGQGYISPLLALYTPTNNETELRQAWEVTLNLIAQLQQEVQADGARFGVVVINPEEVFSLRLQPEATLTSLISQSPDLAGVEIDLPNRRLAEFFEARGIQFLDLIEPMLAKQQQDQIPLYMKGDRHWTVEGNRVVAELIAQWLEQADLLAH